MLEQQKMEETHPEGGDYVTVAKENQQRQWRCFGKSSCWFCGAVHLLIGFKQQGDTLATSGREEGRRKAEDEYSSPKFTQTKRYLAAAENPSLLPTLQLLTTCFFFLFLFQSIKDCDKTQCLGCQHWEWRQAFAVGMCTACYKACQTEAVQCWERHNTAH